MVFNDVFVLFTALTVTISGYYINFARKAVKSTPILVAEDNSLLIFRLLIPAGLLVSIGFYFSKIGLISLPPYYRFLGYFLVIFGLLLRWTAVRSLGQSFQVQVSLIQDQTLFTEGVYKKIRHPSYTGLLLYYWGLGLVMQNYICFIILSFIPLFVVIRRINLEETFLVSAFGTTYQTYQKKTHKLFPFIY